MGLLEDQLIKIAFDLGEEYPTVSKLLIRYQSVPMSLADACLVRMAELYKNSLVMTFDSDFKIYRMNRNQTILLLLPENV